jgi:hypothetical protein
VTGSRRRWWLAVPAALVLAQAVQPARTNPPVRDEVPAPPAVLEILRRACWDCHSNETVWAWHTRVAPVSWLTVHDVNEGRRELNFSDWGRSLQKEKVAKKIVDALREGEMPPLLYVLAHPAARLSDRDQAAVADWARTLR